MICQHKESIVPSTMFAVNTSRRKQCSCRLDSRANFDVASLASWRSCAILDGAADSCIAGWLFSIAIYQCSRSIEKGFWIARQLRFSFPDESQIGTVAHRTRPNILLDLSQTDRGAGRHNPCRKSTVASIRHSQSLQAAVDWLESLTHLQRIQRKHRKGRLRQRLAIFFSLMLPLMLQSLNDKRTDHPRQSGRR